MGKGILVLGESGSGKSTSIETLDPKSTFIINIKGKDMPFKGWSKNYTTFSKDNPNGNYLGVWDATSIIKVMNHISEKMPHIKTIIIDDFQYMSATDLMNRSNEKGFEKFSIIGKNIFDVIDQFNKLRNDLYVVYTNHLDEFIDSTGDRRLKAKTVGKLVDNVITLEGMFTMVLYAKTKKGKDGMEYVFSTQNDGSNTCKTPKGMFDKAEIPNDLGYVISKIEEYYK